VVHAEEAVLFAPKDGNHVGRNIMGTSLKRVMMETMSDVAQGQPVLDDVVRRIAEQFSPDQIILFGSRARGDARPDSDIDLLVLFPEVANPDKRAAELYASLADFPRPMDIVVSTSYRFERYRNVVNTVYWPASREGKVLYERAA
jgi:predicted nucleotidyltransferase